MPAPTVTSITPASGPLAGGTSMTITGTNFTGTTGVTIGGASASFSVVNSTTITGTTPAGSAGTASVVVTNASGANGANSLFTYVAAPTVTGVTPSSGPLAGGASVTITGNHFTGATGVTIGGAAASFSVGDNNTITCTTPAGSAGTASVLVTTPGGTNAANAFYTFVAAPTVTGITPASGTANGGTSVTITGTNFSGATSVTIGGVAVTSPSVVSSTSITCTTPTGSGGAASVLVTTPGGTNAANSFYTYVLTPPTVTSVSPSSGTSAGGTPLTITGTNFSVVTGVTIRGVAATGVSVVSSTSITCTAPAGSVGAASVLVTTPSGANAANSLFSYSPPAPTVSSVFPTTGSTLGGATVTITGTNLTGAGGVTIGGVPATNVIVNSDTSVTCISPAGSVGTASVVVTTAGGHNADNTLFTFALTAPSVTDISPNRGTSEGGTQVTVTGANFTGATGVSIGGAAASRVVVINDTTITCITPAGSTGSGKSVVVTSPNGHNAGNLLFTYVQALPTVTSVSPPIGTAAGGTSVTLTGTHFTGATDVSFGGMPATGLTVVNETTLTCTTPAGLAGSASVLVTAAAGTSPANSLYLYVQGVPTDTYIYLKGGRGDGFVPQWTGTLTEEGMVSDSGGTLGTAGREVSEPYRDIFPSSTVTQDYGSYQLVWYQIPYTTGGKAASFYPDEQATSANSGKGRLSDEVAHAKPRQYARVATWLIFTSQNGLPYKFRKDSVVGWGSQPRSE
jgi:hypothetical protein